MTTPDTPFDAPWQAELFALTVALNEAGGFDWPEWTAAFGPRVQSRAASEYWTVWSDTLVALLEAKGLAGPGEIARLARLWQEAARATPHGQPIPPPVQA